MATSNWQNATTEIHSGYSPAGPHRPMTVPIYNSAAFEFPDYATAAELFSLKKAGFTYSRTGNPTVSVLEARAAALEGGIGALATATGQAAVAVSLLALLQGPNHLVASNKLYGGTVDLLTDTFADFGVTVTFVDPEDPANWAAAITEKTRGFLLESVSNPLITLVDLRAIADVAHAAGIPVVVDNTLATPAAYRPIEFGADIVVHSATKALAGHGSVLGGLIVDAGTFDFSDPARWPQIAAPKARYYGDSLLERYGANAYLMLARSKFLHDLGPTLTAASASAILTGHRDPLAARGQGAGQRAGPGGGAQRAPGRGQGPPPVAARPPGPRAGAPGLPGRHRLRVLLRPPRCRRRPAGRRLGRTLRPGRQHRRRTVADRAPRRHDPLPALRRAACRRRDLRRDPARLGGPGGLGGPDRGPDRCA